MMKKMKIRLCSAKKCANLVRNSKVEIASNTSMKFWIKQIKKKVAKSNLEWDKTSANPGS